MELDRKIFFDSVRETLFAKLSQEQVDGLGFLLSHAESNGWDNLDHLAYTLATVYHETAQTMQPIRERGSDSYFFKMYDKKGERPNVARDLGNIEDGDGVKFHGRGYVQITGRRNYKDWSDRLNLDLVKNPEFALDKDVAVEILFGGMQLGTFTGKKLSNYFNSVEKDPINARRIVNGKDRAEEIAGYYEKFLKALSAAYISTPVTEEIIPVDIEKRLTKIENALKQIKDILSGL